jgi:hypothetical protein
MNTTINLKGNWSSKQVWLNGKKLSPAKSLRISNHSPDGFNWGYAGSGPAQLALAICIELAGVNFKERKFGPLPFNYQEFKRKYIASLPQSDFDTELEVEL